ncbi:MAG: amino acid transporter [Candidatus Omnitrophica bacterium]|nr:amino acid transporter [Candidatus Omnitrophota bacterium]
MLLTKKVDRPRELKWYQAGSMLYGDWGTSKAYVLGIAFAMAGHASWFFLGLMSVLTAIVGICYMTICRLYPDGGGVYSSVKNRSQSLAVMGALLLIADYVVTASLSAIEAFHYFNFPHPELWAILSIVIIGAMNWVGPSEGGRVAAFIAVAASVAAGILFVSTLPHLPHVELSWPQGNLPQNWSVFVGIVLSLSGVEAVANMTGIMVEPVEETSRKSIFPVLLEVSVLTFLLGIAMNAIPHLTGHTEDMLRMLGNHYIGNWYGQIISVIFGFLLLSAVNTAITGLVSMQFILSKDREIPSLFSRLNRFGMPWLSLLIAVVLPILVLLFEHDVVGLASLYAIGVVGAIVLNLGACATNFHLRMKTWERTLLISVSVILFFVEVTICFQKHHALIFASTVLATGLILRFFTKTFLPTPAPVLVGSEINVLTVEEAKEIAALYNSSVLVGLRGFNPYLLEEAAFRAKALKNNAIYINYVDVAPPGFELPKEIEPTPEALQLFAESEKELEKYGLTAVPIWQFGNDPGKQISIAARELGVGTVMIGSTKRSGLVSLLRGDILRTLAKNLPRKCHLVISS